MGGKVHLDRLVCAPALVTNEAAQAIAHFLGQARAGLGEACVVAGADEYLEVAGGQTLVLGIRHDGLFGVLLKNLVDLGWNNLAAEDTCEAVIQPALKRAVELLETSKQTHCP